MDKQLKDLTDVEIKAFLYDQVVVIENAKKNMQVLVNEQNRRKEEQKKEKVTEKIEKLKK